MPSAVARRGGSPRRLVRWALAGIVMFSTALATLAWQSYTADRTSVRRDAQRAAEVTARGAQAFVDGELAALRAVAATPTVQAGEPRAMLALFETPAVRALGSGALAWVPVDGRLTVLTDTPPEELPSLRATDVSQRPSFRAIVRLRRREYVGAALRATLRKGLVLAIAVPTYDERGALSGMLSATQQLDAPSLARLFSTSNVVIDRDDQVIWDGGPIRELRTATNTARAVRAARHGSLADATGLSGTDGRLLGYADVARAGWVVSVETSWGRAIGGARNGLAIAWAAIGLVAFGASAATVLVSRRADRAHRTLLGRARRDETLATASAALAAAPDVKHAATTLVEHASRALHADGGLALLLTRDGTALEVAACAGDGRLLGEVIDIVPLDQPCLSTAVVREGRTLGASNRKELAAMSPETAALLPEAAACVATPIRTSGRPTGCVGLVFRDPRQLASDDLALLEALVAHAAAAIERARHADVLRDRDARIAAYSHARAEVASRLAAADRALDVADVVTRWTAEVFETSGTMVLVSDDADPRCVVLGAHGLHGVEAGTRVDVTDLPAGDVLADGEARVFECAADMEAAYPRLAASAQAGRFEAAMYLPLRAGGKVLGVLQLMWDHGRTFEPSLRDDVASLVTKVAQALARARLSERLMDDARRAERLADLAGALAEADTTADIAEATATACTEILGVQSASVAERARDHAYVVHMAGPVSDRSRQRWRSLSTRYDSHPRRAFTTGDWQAHSSPESIAAAFPELAPEFGRFGVGAMLSVPLLDAGTVQAVLTLTWSHPREVTAGERDWIRTVANAVSQGLVRTRLARRDDAARDRAEAIARLAATVAELREPEELAATVVREVRAATGADRATIFEFDAGSDLLVRVETSGETLGRELTEIPVAGELPAALAARSRRPVYLSRADLEEQHPEVAAQFPALHAGVALPMMAHGELTGVLVLTYRSPRDFEQAERAHLGAVAAHIALALERARLFHEQRDLAETLQRSMLPGVLAPPAGLLAAGEYVPGTEGLLIGGDWYDLVSRDDGSALMIVGDVAGHGRDAAIIMGRLRTLVTAHAGLTPGALLDVLHAQCERDATMATCAVLALDPLTGVTHGANAGHLPFAAISPDGETRLVDLPPSLPLGVAAVPYPTHTVEIAPGSLLIGYTDGLIERRRESLSDGLRRLVDECRLLTGADPGSACTHLLASLHPPTRGDDTVVLAVRTAPAGAPLDLIVPATALSARAVREPLRRWLLHRGVDQTVARDLLIATGEAVANAITHAYPAGQRGPIRVRAEAADGEITITIADEGRWRAPNGDQGMGLRLIRALGRGEVDASNDGTTVRLGHLPGVGRGSA